MSLDEELARLAAEDLETSKEEERDEKEEEEEVEEVQGDVPVVVGSSQRAFEGLLRSAITSSSAITEVAPETRASALAAVQNEDFSALDLGSLLGSTLSTLSAEMGLDVSEELSRDRGPMRVLVRESMAELAASMQDLDKANAELYDRLGKLEGELLAETETFEAKKSLELADLLDDQNRLRSEISASQQRMTDSADRLDSLMSSLETQADPLTALAMFPLKSNDKKAAFVVALAIAFKVPFDIAVRGAAVEDLFSLATQCILAFTCLYHYGLVQAFGRKPLEI